MTLSSSIVGRIKTFEVAIASDLRASTNREADSIGRVIAPEGQSEARILLTVERLRPVLVAIVP
jgi:hypothetical protein